MSHHDKRKSKIKSAEEISDHSLQKTQQARIKAHTDVATLLTLLQSHKWKKADEVRNVLTTRVIPTFNLAQQYSPLRIIAEEQNLLQSISKLVQLLQSGTTSETRAVIFRVNPTAKGFSQIKKSVTELEKTLHSSRFSSLDTSMSTSVIDQIFQNLPSAKNLWQSCFQETEYRFQVQWEVIWEKLKQIQSHPVPFLERCKKSANVFLASDNLVNALSFADFAVQFAPIEDWCESMWKLIFRPGFLWRDDKNYKDSVAYLSKKKLKTYLIRFSRNSRSRLVIEVVTGESPFTVNALPVDVSLQNNSPVYCVLDEQYNSLDEVLEAFQSEIEFPLDCSPFCDWCWNIPVAMEQIASIFSKNLKENLGFCMLRIRLVGRTARVLCRINNGQVEDYNVETDNHKVSVTIDNVTAEGDTLLDLVNDAICKGLISSPVFESDYLSLPSLGNLAATVTSTRFTLFPEDHHRNSARSTEEHYRFRRTLSPREDPDLIVSPREKIDNYSQDKLVDFISSPDSFRRIRVSGDNTPTLMKSPRALETLHSPGRVEPQSQQPSVCRLAGQVFMGKVAMEEKDSELQATITFPGIVIGKDYSLQLTPFGGNSQLYIESFSSITNSFIIKGTKPLSKANPIVANYALYLPA